MEQFLGIDCGSVSLNIVLHRASEDEPISVYRRTMGRPLDAFIQSCDDLLQTLGTDVCPDAALVTGSGRELLSTALKLPAINEISAHAAGVFHINPEVRTIIEIGGQDSKFIKIMPPKRGKLPQIKFFRMNEICAAGTGSFLDEQADRLGISIDMFGPMALQSREPASIAGRCAVFAKTDMIHQSQEGKTLPDVLLGLAFALVRNYFSGLVRGECVEPLVSLQGGVMSNQAVVHAFREFLHLEKDHVVIPPHFKVLGALGCAILAARECRSSRPRSIRELRNIAEDANNMSVPRSHCLPLDPRLDRNPPTLSFSRECMSAPGGTFVMGLDVGSVSVKGVLVDQSGRIARADYRFSHSRPLEAVDEVLKALTADGMIPNAIAVTGSGRQLTGKLLAADLVVNEITAQAEAALHYAPDADTVVEIGGQDSKWIGLEQGGIVDFEMNRVCAAGTGSFLMAQAQRLSLDMGPEFSRAAFSSNTPADLGNRCTVFMESDLIHHQNNGATQQDLAAGVCISVVRNYLERVANHRPIGKKVLFLGGVAAASAVRAAFEQSTGVEFHVPEFFKVSGAFGAALKVLDKVDANRPSSRKSSISCINPEEIRKETFACKGCSNTCSIDRYVCSDRTVYQGGLCDRWEVDEHALQHQRDHNNLFRLRNTLLEKLEEGADDLPVQWGMVRAPQYYELFPFWRRYCEQLGIGLKVAPLPNRKQFERGSRHLRVETCLPIKVLAGQIEDLVNTGLETLFHPSILSEKPVQANGKPLQYCPYIQASSQFFKESFKVNWIELFVSYALDSDSFRREHRRLASELGFSRWNAECAIQRGMECLEQYRTELREAGRRFIQSLDSGENAFIVLGKPYHTSESFLNLNLGGIFQRLGVKVLPGDLYPLDSPSGHAHVAWKYQERIVQEAAAVSRHPSLFPIMITFFGCGPDPFTLRHVRDALGEKPLLVLEMDEHSSRAGMITRIEAFLERVSGKRAGRGSVLVRLPRQESAATPDVSKGKHHRVLYLPYMNDHSYGFAAAARSVGIDAKVLPPPDQESECLGRPHLVGGECHPYVLILGDYIKLAHNLSPEEASQSLFYILGPDACRLGQFPIYIDKVRQDLGLFTGVIWDVDQAIAAFGLSRASRQKILLKAWEGLHAYDILSMVFHQVRPRTKDVVLLERTYLECRDHLCDGLAEGRVRQTMEEVLHQLYGLPLEDASPRPCVAITGDYYTRVVPFANNNVYSEVEALGGTVLPPPTFTDSVKMGALRDLTWSLLNFQSRAAARESLFYMLLAVSEFRVKGSKPVRHLLKSRLDLMGREMWRSADKHAHTRLPAGITAPVVTALQQCDQGADGVLNLMTLNCSYGTVVTAALARALKERGTIPMITLVYDGLKKTNEKTRLEAFMVQVRDHFLVRQAG